MKTLLVLTDIGLLAYWVLTTFHIISVGGGELLTAWNWSFLPLDLAAIIAGLTWSWLPAAHRLSTPFLIIALALTHAAGLMAISFFVLWGSWDFSWWAVNLWLAFLPISIAITKLSGHDRFPSLPFCDNNNRNWFRALTTK